MKKSSLFILNLLALLASVPAQAAEPAAGSVWKEPSSGMEFVWIPSGCFQMGSSGNDEMDEQPIHQVCLKGFYLGKYEVTQAQYQSINGSNPSHFANPNNPVEMVSWKQAQTTAEGLSTRSGLKFRLPSEAEWEYACRAGGKHQENCGEGALDKLAWYGNNSNKATHAVGQMQPNAWGLYDMSGNVWEWAQDNWHDDYKGAPSDGSAWEGGGDRILRGGSWFDEAPDLHTAERSFNEEAMRLFNIGFRLVRTLP